MLLKKKEKKERANKIPITVKLKKITEKVVILQYIQQNRDIWGASTKVDPVSAKQNQKQARLSEVSVSILTITVIHS